MIEDTLFKLSIDSMLFFVLLEYFYEKKTLMKLTNLFDFLHNSLFKCRLRFSSSRR